MQKAASNKKVIEDPAEVAPLVISFWFMQSMFWITLTVVTFFSLTLWYGTAEWPHILHTLFQSAVGLLLGLPMHWIFRALWSKSTAVKVLSGFLVVTIFSFLWSVIRVASFIWFTTEGDELWKDFGGWYFSAFFIFLCWTAIYYSIHYYKIAIEEHDRRLRQVEKSRQEKIRRLQAEGSATESRMKMLRYQLNPHFLFNTLNSINALIVAKETSLARQTVEHLSAFLRFALKEEKRGWVSLASEIEALEFYLEIERIRFSDRLQVAYNVEEPALEARVPSLLLQPLVENSIKYAINALEEGGLIQISARIDKGNLLVCVKDNGPGMSALEEGKFRKNEFKFTGLGIQNISDRLESIYKDMYEMNVYNTHGKGLEIELMFPFEREIHQG